MDHEDHREIIVFSFRVLIIIYMPLGRQAGSNQRRGNLGNCVTVSPDSRRQRSFSLFTGEVWRSTYSHVTCCDVTAQLQSHVVSLNYQALRSHTKTWHAICNKGKKKMPLHLSYDLSLVQNHQIVMVHKWPGLFPLVCSIVVLLPLPFPDKPSYKLSFELVSILC